MNTITDTKRESLEAALRALEKGGDTARMDAFLDELFRLAAAHGAIKCDAVNGNSLRVQSSDEIVCEIRVLRALPKLRALCARLSVRCSEWSGQEVSHYGDEVEFVLPGTKQYYKVEFENTPTSQRIRIDSER